MTQPTPALSTITIGAGSKIVLMKIAAEFLHAEPHLSLYPEYSARLRALMRTLECLNSSAHAWVLAEAKRSEQAR